MKKHRLLCFSLAAGISWAAAHAQTDTPLQPSGTLPVLIINTEGQRPIEDRETQIPALLSLDIPEGIEIPHPEEFPQKLADPVELTDVSLTIRGRGNTSWTRAPQKPYKLKFDTKTAILGMPASRHFALINGDVHVACWLSPLIGMHMGRQLGMPWCPRIQPVEVVLNGSYEGLYLLIESMKIASDRLDMYKQPDLNTDPGTIPYGWLVEMDNNYDTHQISIPEREGKTLALTYKYPEELSGDQLDWLKEEFSTLTSQIYAGDPEPFANGRLDLESLAQFITVAELMNDVEAYSGSQFMYRDLPDETGPVAPWHFGPLWDIELLPYEKTDWIIDKPYWSRLNWMPALYRYAEVGAAFRSCLQQYLETGFQELPDYIHSMARYCAAANDRSLQRWPGVTAWPDISAAEKADWAIDKLRENAGWIAGHIDELAPEVPSAIDTPAAAPSGRAEPDAMFNLLGIPVSRANARGGIYIVRSSDGTVRTVRIRKP